MLCSRLSLTYLSLASLAFAACGQVADENKKCTSDQDCSDNTFCNGEETCELATGACVPGTPVVCSDNFACTVNFCDEDADQCGVMTDNSVCSAHETCGATTGCVVAPACRALDW